MSGEYDRIPPAIFPCDCGTAMIVIDPLLDGEDLPSGAFCVALWEWCGLHLGLWDRLRLAWHVITRGRAPYDDVILSPSEARRLARYLQEEP